MADPRFGLLGGTALRSAVAGPQGHGGGGSLPWESRVALQLGGHGASAPQSRRFPGRFGFGHFNGCAAGAWLQAPAALLTVFSLYLLLLCYGGKYRSTFSRQDGGRTLRAESSRS